MTPLRIKRLDTRGTRFESAELITRHDGGPVRLTNGRRTKMVGRFFSTKTESGHLWESRNELHAMLHAEVDSSVRRYRAQPHVLTFTTCGVSFRYTPDREDTLAGGRIEIIEVKERFKRDRDWSLKLGHARAIYGALGWSFRVVERHEIEAEPLFASVKEVQARSRAAITAADVLSVQRLLTRIDAAAWAEVEAVFPSSRPAFDIICAMTVRRIVTLDLTRGLHRDTPVRLVCKEAVAWAA